MPGQRRALDQAVGKVKIVTFRWAATDNHAAQSSTSPATPTTPTPGPLTSTSEPTTSTSEPTTAATTTHAAIRAVPDVSLSAAAGRRIDSALSAAVPWQRARSRQGASIIVVDGEDFSSVSRSAQRVPGGGVRS